MFTNSTTVNCASSLLSRNWTPKKQKIWLITELRFVFFSQMRYRLSFFHSWLLEFKSPKLLVLHRDDEWMKLLSYEHLPEFLWAILQLDHNLLQPYSLQGQNPPRQAGQESLCISSRNSPHGLHRHRWVHINIIWRKYFNCLSFFNAGSYVCSFNGSEDLQSIESSTPIHIYVFDEHHLLTHSGRK